MSRTIFKALTGVQKDIAAKGISKDQTNTYDKYKFRGIDAVLNALAPIFAERGVILAPTVKDKEIKQVQTAKGGTMNHCIVTVEFTFYDEEGDSISHQFIGEAMDRGDKSINKACTAAYKYFLFEVFTIPVEGSGDADEDTHELAEPEVIHPGDVEAFTQSLAAADPFAFIALWSQYNEDQKTALFNAAPHGQKTKWKDAARDLEREAHARVGVYVEEIQGALAGGDLMAIEQLMSEMEQVEKRMVWARLTDIEKAQINQLKEQAA